MNVNEKTIQHEIIDLTNEEIDHQEQLIKEERVRIEEEEQRIIDDEVQRLQIGQQLIEEERRVIEEQQRILEEEQRIEAENLLRLEIENERLRQEHDHVNNAEDQRLVQLENERRARVRVVANQITNASTTRYIPCEKQVRCVTAERYTVQEALTIGGDAHTPCRECLRNEPDECFWILSSVGLNVLGRQWRTGRQAQNNQVRFFCIQAS